MKKVWIPLFLTTFLIATVGLAGSIASGTEPAGPEDFWRQFRESIEGHLGRPYVWGACGLKSFDCSGFVWRAMADSGLFFKRTTARKLYLSLPEVTDTEWKFGTLVFFNDLKHVGIVADRDSFYHSETSIGTNLSKFDPYWRAKIYGFRALPMRSR